MFDFGNANDGQRQAISTTEGPVLITAGPGTGKTYTLVQRAIYLIEERGVKPEDIFIATFTEKAAKELITRITNELASRNITVNVNEMYVGTFHSLCLRIIKDHLEYTRLKKNYRLLDTFDQQYLVFRNIYKFRTISGIENVMPKGGAWKWAQAICEFSNNLTEEIVDIDAMLSDHDMEISVIAILKLNSAIVTSDIPTFEFKSVDLTQLEPYIQNPNRNAVRMLLKTLAYEHQDDLLPAKWEIEHIFPQKWQTNYFPDEPDATIKEKIEHIGNKLPFEKKLNIVAGNGYFGKKKKEYTASKIVITKAMGTSDVMDWNLESITKRDIRVSDEVVKIMNRWNNEYLNISISEGKMGEPSEEELAQIEKFKKNGWI